MNRGVAYEKLEQYDNALADHHRSVELNPHHLSYYNRGVIYEKKELFDEAISDYTRSIELNMLYAPAYRNRGATYGLVDDYIRAIQDLSRAIKLDDTDPISYSRRAYAFYVLERYDEAMVDAKRALELDPNDILSNRTMGLLCIRQGKTNDVMLFLEKAAQLGDDFSKKLMEHLEDITQQEADSEVDLLDKTKRSIAFVTIHEEQTFEELKRQVEQLPFLTDANILDHLTVSMDSVKQENKRIVLTNLSRLKEIAEEKKKKPSPTKTPEELVFNAFKRASSFDEMRQAVNQFPVLASRKFITGLNQMIRSGRVPLDQEPSYFLRLGWLSQLALEQLEPSQILYAESVNQAIEAFESATTFNVMRQVAMLHSIMTTQQFLQIMEILIDQRVPLHLKTEYNTRLAWLKTIIQETTAGGQ